MRIIILSNGPWMGSGYGQQCGLLATRLRDLGHDIAICSYAGLHQTTAEFDGIPVYPGGINGAIGMDVIAHHYARHKADVCLALSDAWALAPRVMRLLRTVCWMPVDQDPLSVMNTQFLRESQATPLAFARFGQRVLGQAGFDAGYIPHAIDTQMYAPRDKAAQRAEAGLSPDTFVIAANWANRDKYRKGAFEQLAAFALFHRRHPDSKILLHMALEHPKGLDLPLILDQLGVPSNVSGAGDPAAIFCNQGAYAAGEIPAQVLAEQLYGPADLYSGCSYAEGFGLPILEAEACGVPTVVTRGSAMTEVGAPGWLVDAEPFWVPPHEAKWDRPPIAGIAAAYEEAWQAREDGTLAERGVAAREHALAYDADLIAATMWKPYLDGLAATL